MNDPKNSEAEVFSSLERVPMSKRSAAELRAQAVEYRRMAESARTLDVARSLLQLADRFDALAEQRNGSGTGNSPG